MIRSVAIVGGGFSGALLAINLLRCGGPHVTLIERGDRLARGLAYGAAHAGHLLNVRAANMSAFHDDPTHFQRWLHDRGLPDGGDAFAPRLLYGDYLRELIDAAIAAEPGRLTILQATATNIVRLAKGTHITLHHGQSVKTDAAVVAAGNLPPHHPPGIVPDALPRGSYMASPWQPGALDGLSDRETILAIGTGLTMVDVALSLRAAGFGGNIVALSRRGLLPQHHAPAGPVHPRLNERPRETGSALVARVRARARMTGWRHAIDELRPFTQAMWATADAYERGRFLRHLRPWWDIHRHRTAPQVAIEITALRETGGLQVHAGKIVTAIRVGDRVAVRWRPRGHADARTLVVDRIVNCTGPQGDLLRTEEPLLRALIAKGAIRPDPMRLGIDVDAQSRVLDRDGQPCNRLYAIGPMTRGAFWEIVAVPDIRVQSWSVARHLANAHWVGGEGL